MGCAYCCGPDVAVVVLPANDVPDEEIPLCVACHSAFELGLELAVLGYGVREIMLPCDVCGERNESRFTFEVPPYAHLCPECALNHKDGWL